jgi:hypothetical protein
MTKHIISLGAGVQSSTLALMAAKGEITPMPECAIFADTMSEPKSVYDWLDWLEKQLPFPVHRVSKGDLGEYAVTVRTSKTGTKWTGGWPPVYAISDSGVTSPMMRQCTQDFKIKPIQSFYKKHYKKQNVIQWIGISFDEIHRMKPSRDEYVENRWPLIDLRMKRYDCLNWMERNGYPHPPRSACVFCPYQRDREWLRLKTEEPNEFAKAVMFEQRIQIAKNQINFKGDVFLHRSLQPLDQVNFNPNENQVDMFGNECEGMCGV